MSRHTSVAGFRVTRMSAPAAKTASARLVAATWAIELGSDRETRERLDPYAGTSREMMGFVAGYQQCRMLPFANFNRIHLVPPLVTTASQVCEAVGILDAVLTEVEGSG